MLDLILTDQNFSEEVLKSQKPVLVDFWAEWCVPCQIIAPILEEVAEEFGEKIKIGKLDVDKNPLISATFSINAIPALILFRNGEVTKKFVGVQSKEAIEESVKSILEEKEN